MNITKQLVFYSTIFSVLILSLISANNVFSRDLFYDDFDSGTLNKWENIDPTSIEPINGWRIENNQMVGEVRNGYYSTLRARSTQNLKNFIMEFDAFNVSGVDHSIKFRASEDFNTSYMINFRYKDPYWSQDNNNVALWKFIGDNYYLVASYYPPYESFDITQGIWHHIKLTVQDKSIKVYFDNNLIINTQDNSNTSLISGSVALYNWGGHYFERSTKNLIDNFKISSIDNSNSRKIFIIPGLGASWNSDAFVYREDVSSDQWKMTPFVKTYDGLISSLKKNGLNEGTDFYVWNYDWRKPISEIVEDFNAYIETKTDDEDIVLIGHSLGGLVSRIWKQEHGDGKEVEVFTLGSPNYGSVKAYEAWSGGKLSQTPDISSIAINILLQLNQRNGSGNLESFKSFAPVLKDLIPTFDFIKKQDQVLPINNMESKNQYLAQKNTETTNYNLKSYVGSGFATREWINVEDRSVFDQVLGIWPDGKPIGYNEGDGDGTVLKKSSNLTGSTVVEITSNHNEIVNKSINDILTTLNLADNEEYSSPNFLDSLVFFIGSPADLAVKCDNDAEVNDQDGLIIMKNNNYKKCLLSLKGNNNGIYHLVSGTTGQINNWKYLENQITTGEDLKFYIDAKTGEISDDDSNVSYLNKLIERDIKLLLNRYNNSSNLNNALSQLNKNKIDVLIDYIFKFRKQTKEDEVSNRILNNSKILLEINNKKYAAVLAKTAKIQALQNKMLIDKLAVASKKNHSWDNYLVNSYLNAKELIDQSSDNVKNGNSVNAYADIYLGSRYLMEVY
jgi:pimeloyl-ACP methyl ester carboxylesterase